MNEADDLDRAAELTQRLTDSYVSAARSLSKPEQVQNPDGTWPYPDCVDCGAEMRPERLKLQRCRCVDCQESSEKSARWRR